MSCWDYHSSESQSHVHGTVERNVTHSSAVRPPLVRLQLVNDLHGTNLQLLNSRLSTLEGETFQLQRLIISPDLRGATDCANRECGSQGIPRVKLRLQNASNCGADVHDMAITLDVHEAFYLDRAVDSHLQSSRATIGENILAHPTAPLHIYIHART